jgi:hypothetical protein
MYNMPTPCRLNIIFDLEMVLLSCACQDFFLQGSGGLLNIAGLAIGQVID